MNEDENRSLRDCYTDTSIFNQLDFIIERKIKDMVNTAALVRVDSCTSTGASGDAGTVSATPLVAQTDANGDAIPMVSIPRLPHYRMQAGIAAIVLDPVPNDIGVAVFCKADSSTVGVGETEPQRAGSFRAFDQSDGMLIASVNNKAPTVYIELKQDNTIVIQASGGITVTAPSVTVVGGDVIADGISLVNHTHTCPDGVTSAPN